MTLDFQIGNQIITRKDKHRVVADSQNYLYASFLFSEDWSGVAKTAVFRNEDNEAYNILLDETDTCLVPAEVLKEGEVSVSVFGGGLITANKAYIYVEESGLVNGITPQPPTPNIYSQILEVAQSAEQTAQSVEDRADSGEFKGEKGDKGDKGDDYTLTEQDKEDIADLAAAEIDISGKLDKFQGTENVGKAMVVKPDGELAPASVSGSSVRTVFTPTSPTHSIYDFNADTVYDIAAAFQLILPDSEGTQRKRIDVKAGSILYLATKNNGNYYAGSVYPYYQTNLVADIAFFAMDKTVSTTNVNLTTFASIVTALANKQDALAAGAGVTINDNVISADVGLHFQVLQRLPQTGDSLYIYLIPNSGSGTNVYNEYIWVNNRWEKIGTTEIDLTNYVTQTDLNNTIESVYQNYMPVRHLAVNSLPVSDISTDVVYVYNGHAYRYDGENWRDEGITELPTKTSDLTNDSGFITQTELAPIETDIEQAQEDILTKQPKNKVFSNITVPTSAWEEEQTPTYTDYPYRADITCQGVSATDLVNIYYSDTDRANANLYDGGNRSVNTVSIYAKEAPESAINIDYIIAEVVV